MSNRIHRIDNLPDEKFNQIMNYSAGWDSRCNSVATFGKNIGPPGVISYSGSRSAYWGIDPDYYYGDISFRNTCNHRMR